MTTPEPGPRRPLWTALVLSAVAVLALVIYVVALRPTDSDEPSESSSPTTASPTTLSSGDAETTTSTAPVPSTMPTADAESWRMSDFASLELPPNGPNSTGPAVEACETEGLVIGPEDYPDLVNSAEPGSVILLTAGTYEGNVALPAGTGDQPTVLKPYDCQDVEIFGGIEPDSHTTIAGLRIDSNESFTILVTRNSEDPVVNVTIRNNEIRGGEVESIRIARNARRIDVIGNHLDGGERRHVLKVHYEESGWHPAEVRIVNNVFVKTETGSGTDLLQSEGHESVLIMNNSFADGGSESAIDIKTAGVGGAAFVTNNYFDGSGFPAACLLVQGEYADNVVTDNFFDNGCRISLGAHPEQERDPWWQFMGNTIIGGTLQLRRSFDAEVVDNVMEGGELKLGLEDGDHPRDAVISANRFVQVNMIDRVTPSGDVFTCTGNELIDVTGDWGLCT